MQSLGFWVNMLDVCPESAVTLMGFSNTVATIPGIVGQPITQAILDSSGSSEPWVLVFGLGGAGDEVPAQAAEAGQDGRDHVLHPRVRAGRGCYSLAIGVDTI